MIVARECCAAGSNIDLSADSPMGAWIRTYLVTQMDELDAGGYTKRISKEGGKLTELLVEVLVAARAK